MDYLLWCHLSKALFGTEDVIVWISPSDLMCSEYIDFLEFYVHMDISSHKKNKKTISYYIYIIYSNSIIFFALLIWRSSRARQRCGEREKGEGQARSSANAHSSVLSRWLLGTTRNCQWSKRKSRMFWGRIAKEIAMDTVCCTGKWHSSAYGLHGVLSVSHSASFLFEQARLSTLFGIFLLPIFLGWSEHQIFSKRIFVAARFQTQVFK